MKRLLIGSSIVGLVGYLLWPYLTLLRLDRAIDEADAVALEELVDWTSVRGGLRDDMNAALGRVLSDSSSGEGALAGALAAVIGPGLIDQLVDSYVTPSGLATMLRSGQLEEQSNSPGSSDAENNDQGLFDRLEYAFFSGPTTFRVRLKPENEDFGITALLRFENLSWRLTRVFLPLEALEQRTTAEPTGG